jgi:hypothetical protein
MNWLDVNKLKVFEELFFKLLEIPIYYNKKNPSSENEVKVIV